MWKRGRHAGCLTIPQLFPRARVVAAILRSRGRCSKSASRASMIIIIVLRWMTFSFVCPGPARSLAFTGISDRLSLELSVSASVTGRSDARIVTTGGYSSGFLSVTCKSISLGSPTFATKQTYLRLCVSVHLLPATTCIFTRGAIVPSDLYPSVETHPLRGHVSPARTTTSLLAPSYLLFLMGERERVFQPLFVQRYAISINAISCFLEIGRRHHQRRSVEPSVKLSVCRNEVNGSN